MKTAIRVDASNIIGSGHVMRCLALADALRGKGVVAQFICRSHEGNLIGLIRNKQYVCHALDLSGSAGGGMVEESCEQLPEHAPWLGVHWLRDAEATGEVLKREGCHWLIVDHYALDWRWESALRSLTEKIMVIDDLADRKHDCDVLLDSACGREPAHYQGLVAPGCRFLLGGDFALLRAEFAEWRSTAVRQRRGMDTPRRFLVTLGGMDPGNLTSVVLEKLAQADVSADSEIEVILGTGFSHVEAVKKRAVSMPVKTSVSIGVDTMAERMSIADFAIIGGGVSTFEGCCLGLPAIIVIAAENQKKNAEWLREAGVGEIIFAASLASDFLAVFSRVVRDHEWCAKASSRGSRLVDGQGAVRIADVLTDRMALTQ